MTQETRVLVTGGTGFIGSHLVPSLASRGWSTHVLVRAASSPRRLLELAKCATNHVTEGDLATLTSVVDEVDPAVCAHLATYFVAMHQGSDIEELVSTNVFFSTQLAEILSRRQGRHFVNVGTVWQHEGKRRYGPASLYAATKQAFQDILVFYAETRGLSVANVKLADTYGPNDPRNKIVELLLGAARTQKPVELTEGQQLIDLLYVEDAVAALHAALVCKRPGFTSYAVSSGRFVTLRELVDVIEAETGVSVPVVWGAKPYRQREMFGSWHFDSPLPGWTPSISLEEGIRRTWNAGPAEG